MLLQGNRVPVSELIRKTSLPIESSQDASYHSNFWETKKSRIQLESKDIESKLIPNRARIPKVENQEILANENKAPAGA